MGKFIRIVFGIALVSAAGYFLLLKDNSFSYKIPNLDLSEQGVMLVASSTAQNLKNKASDVFSGISAGIQSKAEEIVAAAAQKAADYTFGIIKQGVISGVDSVGEKMGVNINSSEPGTSQSAYVVYSIKKGATAYFTIKNSENDLLKYNVDWLDGKVDSGQLTKKDESIVLTHKWSTAGEYFVTFKITDSNGDKEHRVLIAVLD